MSRAGLVFFVLFSLLIGLATSAPLGERLSSLAERSGDYDHDFIVRSLAILGAREFDIADPEYTKREYLSILDDRDFDIAEDEYTKREYDLSIFEERDLEGLEYTKRDDSDVHILYRRESIFTKIKHAFQKAGHAIKKGFQKAGHAIKSGFQKVGKVLKKGFQKVGTFIKKTGAKIAKFALKVVAAGASVLSKALKFIPGVGTALGMAVKGVAMGANAASNKIHASLGSKLDKVSKGLDYVISPVGSAAKTASKGSKAASTVANILF